MVIIKHNLRIFRGIKFKKFLNHELATAQPLSESGGDQVDCTIYLLPQENYHRLKLS